MHFVVVVVVVVVSISISPSIKDKFILTPGPLTASLEKLLIFFGQVIDTNPHLLCWPSSSSLLSSH